MREKKLNYTSPLKFSTKQKVILSLVPPLVTHALKGIMVTSHSDKKSYHEKMQVLLKDERPLIAAFWHETVVIAAHFNQNTDFHTLTSYSFDGELAARIVHGFGMRTLRGSSNRGSLQALDQLELALNLYHACGFTVDGPRGPRRVVKPGPAILAIRTGAIVVPQAYTVHPAWRLNSWDKFMIPKPFSRLICKYGEPIVPPDKLTPENIEALRKEIETALNALHAEIEAV